LVARIKQQKENVEAPILRRLFDHKLLALLSMSERPPLPYDSIARKWLALAERRYAHVIELSDTGRWRHYFTPAELEAELRKAANLCDEWARIAGLRIEFQQAAE
jgi:hypothetical protein